MKIIEDSPAAQVTLVGFQKEKSKSPRSLMQTTETNSSTLEEINRTKLRTALREFYQKYNTRMVSHVDTVVSDHDCNVPELNKKLRAKYAADLSDVGAYCTLSGNR